MYSTALTFLTSPSRPAIRSWSGGVTCPKSGCQLHSVCSVYIKQDPFSCRSRVLSHFCQSSVFPANSFTCMCTQAQGGWAADCHPTNWFIKMSVWCNSSFMWKLRITLSVAIQERPYVWNRQWAFAHSHLNSETIHISCDQTLISYNMNSTANLSGIDFDHYFSLRLFFYHQVCDFPLSSAVFFTLWPALRFIICNSSVTLSVLWSKKTGRT